MKRLAEAGLTVVRQGVARTKSTRAEAIAEGATPEARSAWQLFYANMVAKKDGEVKDASRAAEVWRNMNTEEQEQWLQISQQEKRMDGGTTDSASVARGATDGCRSQAAQLRDHLRNGAERLLLRRRAFMDEGRPTTEVSVVMQQRIASADDSTEECESLEELSGTTL